MGAMQQAEILKRLRWSADAILVAALAGAVGCGGSYDSTVTGMVTLDGKVVPRGNVAYQPVSGGPVAYAAISENGAYSLRTGRENGLPAGEYQVTVTSNEPATQRQTANGGPPPPGKPITPIWYRLNDTSGLRFTVSPGSNEINLELKSEAPPGWSARGRK
jgi:hypothetical protein